jgi:hypothetical protein
MKIPIEIVNTTHYIPITLYHIKSLMSPQQMNSRSGSEFKKKSKNVFGVLLELNEC